MTITLDVPAPLEAALRADAEAQGRPVATEALTIFYEDEGDTFHVEDPEAVEAIGHALAAADRAKRDGTLLTVDEAFDELERRAALRSQRK